MVKGSEQTRRQRNSEKFRAGETLRAVLQAPATVGLPTAVLNTRSLRTVLARRAVTISEGPRFAALGMPRSVTMTYAKASNSSGRCGSRGCRNFAARDSNGTALEFCDPCHRIAYVARRLDELHALMTHAVNGGPRNLDTVDAEFSELQIAALEALDERRVGVEKNQDRATDQRMRDRCTDLQRVQAGHLRAVPSRST